MRTFGSSEQLYYSALIGYIWYEAPGGAELHHLLEMIDASEVREDDGFKNPVDELFEELKRSLQYFGVRQYKK